MHFSFVMQFFKMHKVIKFVGDLRNQIQKKKPHLTAQKSLVHCLFPRLYVLPGNKSTFVLNVSSIRSTLQIPSSAYLYKKSTI